MSIYPVKPGETRRLRVERLAFGGKGVARIEGYTVFVDRGLPGQTVEAVVMRRKKGFAEARTVRVIEPGPRDIQPRCSHFGRCGGCAIQNLAYEAQLEIKRELVRECLDRIGGLGELDLLPALPSPLPYEYRNKMEFSFADRWLEEDDPRIEPAELRAGVHHHHGRRAQHRAGLHQPVEAGLGVERGLGQHVHG